METVEWTVVFEPRTFDLGVKKPKSKLTDWLTDLGLSQVIFLLCSQVCQELNSSWAWELEQNRYMQMSMESKSTILKVPHTSSTPTSALHLPSLLHLHLLHIFLLPPRYQHLISTSPLISLPLLYTFSPLISQISDSTH